MKKINIENLVLECKEIKVEGTKRIIATSTQGSAGTIKKIVGNDDVLVSFLGVTLRKEYNLTVSNQIIKIENEYLNALGILKGIVKEINDNEIIVASLLN